MRCRMQRVINLTQTGTNESVKSVRAERQRRTQREAAVVGSVVGLERTTGRRTCMQKMALREKQLGRCGSLLGLQESPVDISIHCTRYYSLYSDAKAAPVTLVATRVATRVTGSQHATSPTRSASRRRKRRKKTQEKGENGAGAL